MDLRIILAQLKIERARLDAAIRALEGLGTRRRGPGRPARGKVATSIKRRIMSTAARKRISQMMKKRWAERKRAARG
jgi:hypothetical protein